MEKVTFTCETVTPLFLAGADGTTPELRAPSIKGALRFWWRAMNGHLSLDELRTKEAEIFGDTNKRSGFNILIVEHPERKKVGNDFWNEIDSFIPRGKTYKVPKDNHKGIHYLLYSAFLNEREYYKNKTTFTFEISFKKLEDYKYIINSLTGLLLFGGLGTRSRRGAGSFRITKVVLEGFEDKEKIYQGFEEQLLQIDTVEKLATHYQKLTSPLPQHDNISYSVLKGSKVYFFKPEVDWKNALEKIGKPFYEFRKTHRSRISETPNFGFPIQHKDTSQNKGGITMVAGKPNQNDRKKIDLLLERRASPVLLKVIQTRTDFFPLIIWLNGQLIPNDFEIMDKRGGNRSSVNDTIIKEFIDSLPEKQEITL